MFYHVFILRLCNSDDGDHAPGGHRDPRYCPVTLFITGHYRLTYRTTHATWFSFGWYTFCVAVANQLLTTFHPIPVLHPHRVLQMDAMDVCSLLLLFWLVTVASVYWRHRETNRLPNHHTPPPPPTTLYRFVTKHVTWRHAPTADARTAPPPHTRG